MNILAVDPGATRAGWAIFGRGPTYIASGVVHHPRLPKQTFQGYRLELAERWVDIAYNLIEEYEPSVLVSETVPSRGPEIMDQLYLANVQITTVHAIAYSTYEIKVEQVSARTVQAKIAKRKPNVKITKPQVRQGVIERLPDLKDRLMKNANVYEESDAIAIALWWFIANR